jgi:uncharacterized membrane-anchored protein
MIRHVKLLWIIAMGLVIAPPLPAAEEPAQDAAAFLSQFNWLKGPGTAKMTPVAQIKVPNGFQFTDGEQTRALLKAMGNLTSGTELGFLAPTSLTWFVVFRFSEEGYVKDDEKDKLDATTMLKTIQRGTEYGNRERRRRGYPEMRIVGWEQQPNYNSQTHNLEWAIRGESEGEQVVNFNTRILGRRGVMEVKLVVDPEQLQATLPEYKQLLSTYTFQPGQRYAEYQPGDRVAKYGLAALVTGGAVAVAAKTGLLGWCVLLFKKAWKLVVLAVVAVVSFFKRIITGRSEPRTSVE